MHATRQCIDADLTVCSEILLRPMTTRGSRHGLGVENVWSRSAKPVEKLTGTHFLSRDQAELDAKHLWTRVFAFRFA